MKKIVIIASTALTALFCISCNKELKTEDVINPGQEQVPTGKVHMSFTAGIGTKASVEEGESTVDIKWSADDHIAVWDGTEWCDFAATSVDGATAVFEGEITPDESFAKTSFKAVYPFSAVTDKTASAISVSVPSEQTIPSGGVVDPNAMVSVATCSEDGLLTFEQVCALVKVGLTQEGMSAITLEGTGLAGTVVCADNGSVTSATVPAAKITLSAAEGVLDATDYYIAVLPGTSAPLKVGMLRESDGYTGIRSATSVTFQQGQAQIYIKDTAIGDWEYNISTPEQLKNCASGWSASFTSTVNILEDLDMADIDWTPKNFAGVFNGNNKKIYNFQYTSSSNSSFIASLYGTVKDICFGSNDGVTYDNVSKIVLSNSGTSTSWFYAGLIVRVYENAKLSKVTSFIPVELAAGSTVKTRLGGLIGVIAYFDQNNKPTTITVTIENCTNYGSVSNNATTAAAASNMGGIIGRMDIPVKLDNVVNKGDITCMNPYVVQLGGISSGVFGGSVLNKCTNYGSIDYEVSVLTANTYIGGIAGNVAVNYTNKSTFAECENYGSITLKDESNTGNLYIGGITGLIRNGELSGCKNHGLVDCEHYQVTRLGGISGTIHNSAIANGCVNDGPIKLTQTKKAANFWQGVGGIAGNTENTGPQVINCSTTSNGTISVNIKSDVSNHANKCNIGGIIGIPGSTTIITGNTNNADISAKNQSSTNPFCYVGGIIGHVNSAAGGSDITGNINNGTISNETESVEFSGAGGLFGKMDKARLISGNTINGSVNGVNAGAVAGFNSQAISSTTIGGSVLVNSISKPEDPNEYALWICPNNSGTIN